MLEVLGYGLRPNPTLRLVRSGRVSTPRDSQASVLYPPPGKIGQQPDTDLQLRQVFDHSRRELTYQAHDLLNDVRYLWHGPRNYVELKSQEIPAHIFRLRRRVRREEDFDYYM